METLFGLKLLDIPFGPVSLLLIPWRIDIRDWMPRLKNLFIMSNTLAMKQLEDGLDPKTPLLLKDWRSTKNWVTPRATLLSLQLLPQERRARLNQRISLQLKVNIERIGMLLLLKQSLPSNSVLRKGLNVSRMNTKSLLSRKVKTDTRERFRKQLLQVRPKPRRQRSLNPLPKTSMILMKLKKQRDRLFYLPLHLNC